LWVSDGTARLARVLQGFHREIHMTWRDKLEIGLKNDAPFRKDNLPESQVRGPEIPAGPGRSPIIPAAIEDAENPPDPKGGEEDLPNNRRS